jgi:hypothetical protein
MRGSFFAVILGVKVFLGSLALEFALSGLLKAGGREAGKSAFRESREIESLTPGTIARSLGL